MTDIFKVDTFCDLEEVSKVYRALETISTAGLITDSEKEIERGIKADEYLYELDELDELIYSGSTVKFITNKEFIDILQRGFYPGYYDGSYAAVYDIYDSCLPDHKEDFLVYLRDLSTF